MPTTSARTRGRRWRLAAMLFAAVIALSCVAAASAARKPPDPEASAVLQYTEFLPTAGGPKAPGIGGGDERPARLTGRARGALAGAPASTAKALETIVTSPNYGAPTTRLAGGADRYRPTPFEDTHLGRTAQRTIAVAASTVDDGRLAGLLAAIVLSTVGAAVLGLRRHRS